MKKKGAILIRIVEFMCSVDAENLNGTTRIVTCLNRFVLTVILTQPNTVFYTKMYKLAHDHIRKNIKPYMYGVFMETLVTTLCFCLGRDCTYDVSSLEQNIRSLA